MPIPIEQLFFEGDLVETIDTTALLPLGIQVKILEVEQDTYDPVRGEDGRGYHIKFMDRKGREWNLHYCSSYFKLVKRAGA